MRYDDDSRLATLERELEDLRRPEAGDEEMRADLRAKLLRQAAQPTVRLGLFHRLLTRRPVVLSGLAAGAFAAIGLLGYASLTGSNPLSGPTPASAATILRAAAASGLAPGQAGHYIYTFTASGPTQGASPSGGTVDVWIDPSANPSVSVQAVSLDAPKGGSANPAGSLVGRFAQLGSDIYGYDAAHGALSLPSAGNAAPAVVLPNEAYDGAAIARAVEALAARGSRVVALPPQSLEGVPVEVVQAEGVLNRPALRVTLYFDAQTHDLRGFDTESSDASYPAPSSHVRLQSQSIVPASSVPQGTFTLGLPASFRVEENPSGALATACGATKIGSNGAPADRSSPAEPATVSPLTRCQQHDPSLTADQLVTALSGEPDAQIHAALAAGLLDAQEAASARATLQAGLARLVAGQPAGLG
ncbi:MAG: hypothetical protein ACRDLF_00415 [Solirubrobacteraceae bacterium]